MAVPADRRSRSTPNSRSASLAVRLDVGSSRMSSLAFIERARAIATSCCCAADSSPSGVLAAKPDPDARQLALGVGVHPPAIEQAKGAAARRLAPEEDVAGDVQRVDQLELLVDDGDAEPGGIGRSVQRHGRAVERISPESARWMPARIFISVDLPAPFSPDERHDLAGRDLEVHAIERDHPGKSLGDRRHLQ